MALALYRCLLRILPYDFRREYGDEMVRVVAEHWAATRLRVGPAGASAFWLRQVGALLTAATTGRRPGSGAPKRPPRNLPSRPDRNRTEPMDALLQDLRYSIRSLIKRPGFTLVTAATLALGIGASTAIFSAVHTVLFRELPYADADRIVAVFHEETASGQRGQGLSAANARDLGEAADHLTDVAIADPWSLDLQVDGRAETLRTWSVSEGFLEAAGARPIIGRTFTADEYEGGEPVALLGHASWVARFGGDPAILGSAVSLDGGPVTIVGILPPEFKLPDEKEVWIPRPVAPYDQNARAADYMLGIGRLAPGSTLEEAQDEARRVAEGLAEAYPDTMSTTTFRLVPLREHLFGNVRTPLLVLMGAVGFVLLIACANVAGLMLARGTERQREYALRGALGASGGRLVRQVTIDSFLLAAVGCALGIAIAFAGIQAIRSLGPEHLPRIEEIVVDRTVLLFAVAVAGLSAFLSGLAPSLRFSRPDLAGTLNEGTRGATAGGRGLYLRNCIVVAEIAAAMVLLVGAGLLTRSFSTLLDQELGFDPADRLALQVFAYGYGQDGGMTQAQFVNQVIEEIEALPGVTGVALTTDVPGANDGLLASIDIDLPFRIENLPPPEQGHEPEAKVAQVSRSYFDVMDIDLVAGRPFALTDDSQAPPVVIVNEAMVRRHFGDLDPIGQRVIVGFQQPSSREIVGVVADVRPSGYESEPAPEIYFPLTQTGSGSLTFVIRSAAGAAQLTNPAKEAIWRVNPEQSVWGAATLESLLAGWLTERRFNLLLLGSFAVVALVLAAVGIYGLIAFSVEQRVAEMGIRRALGGGAGSIVGMVLRQAQLLAAAGVVIGVAGAVVLTRFIRGMLFGVEATDPATFVGLALAVLTTAGLAALVPALRATRVDPMVALRSE